MGGLGRDGDVLPTGVGDVTMNIAKHYTMPELVNKKPSTIGEWAAKDTRGAGRRSRLASAGTAKAKALLQRLDKGQGQP